MKPNNRKQISDRMARIHGHVHGIMEMVEDGRPYSEIVQQIAAVKSGLDSTVQAIVEDLVKECISKQNTEQNRSKSILELKEVIARSR